MFPTLTTDISMDPALPAAGELSGQPHAKAAKAFEALITGEFAKMMVSGLDTSGPFGGGHAEGIYRGMMAEHVGEAIARRGGLGLSPAIMDQLIRMEQGS